MMGSSEESPWAGTVRGTFLEEEILRDVGLRKPENAEEPLERGISDWESNLSKGLGGQGYGTRRGSKVAAQGDVRDWS